MPASQKKTATTRAASRGRSRKTKEAKEPKEAKEKETFNMEFVEGANVMARWPATSLYFKVRINRV